jgi:hypothetical protein
VVDVPQKMIQGRQPLRQAFFNFRPLACGNNSRQQVVWENPLGAFFAPVDGKRDSFVKKCEVSRLLALAQLLRRQPDQSLVQRPVMLPRHAGSGEHLVVCSVQAVVHERGGYRYRRWLSCGFHRSFRNPAGEPHFAGGLSRQNTPQLASCRISRLTLQLRQSRPIRHPSPIHIPDTSNDSFRSARGSAGLTPGRAPPQSTRLLTLAGQAILISSSSQS